jgi:hypothetical protein
MRMFWINKSRKDYKCDICKAVIKKGEKRLVYGYNCLAYTMIDKNICMRCFSNESEEMLLKKLNIPLNNLEKLRNLKGGAICQREEQ